MTKPEKRILLNLIAEEQLTEMIEQFKGIVPEAHPDLKRVNQLADRLRELEERIDMGTLSNEDIGRVRSRISGGLRDVVQELKPMEEHSEKIEKEKPIFKLDLAPEAKESAAAPVEVMGFKGEVVYKGSPSKKERSIELVNRVRRGLPSLLLQGIKKGRDDDGKRGPGRWENDGEYGRDFF